MVLRRRITVDPVRCRVAAGLKGTRRGGRIFVDLPRVPQRDPRTDAELVHADYFKETSAVADVPVGGGFPWLRMGWPLLDVVDLPTHDAVVELAQGILPPVFTTLEREASVLLEKLIAGGEV